jgi:hypothetical protein
MEISKPRLSIAHTNFWHMWKDGHTQVVSSKFVSL